MLVNNSHRFALMSNNSTLGLYGICVLLCGVEYGVELRAAALQNKPPAGSQRDLSGVTVGVGMWMGTCPTDEGGLRQQQSLSGRRSNQSKVIKHTPSRLDFNPPNFVFGIIGIYILSKCYFVVLARKKNVFAPRDHLIFFAILFVLYF